MMKKRIIYILLIMLLMFSCKHKKTWENAKIDNTISSYENYLEQFPDGMFADSAKIFIDELIWENTAFVFVSSRDDNDGNNIQNTDIFYQKVNATDAKNIVSQGNGNYHDPDLSPDGNKILFIKNGDINIINTDGSELNKITDTQDNDDPSWTPDGSGILFTSTRLSNVPKLFLMDLATKNIEEIHTNQENIVNPVFSPDGEKIAFAAHNDSTGYNIYIINNDGSDSKQITDDLDLDYSPSWSPDGLQIVYSSYDMSDFTNPNQMLFVTESSESISVIPQDFSSLKHLNSYIKLISIEDLNQQILIESDKNGYDPCWSGDINSIIFTSNMSGNDDIYIMDPDGANIRNLTNNKASDHAAKF